MATATPSSGEGADEEKAGSGESIELRKTKKKSLSAGQLSEELTTVAWREDELHRFSTQEKQQQGGESSTVVKSDVHAPKLSEIVDSGNATECEVNHV